MHACARINDRPGHDIILVLLEAKMILKAPRARLQPPPRGFPRAAAAAGAARGADGVAGPVEVDDGESRAAVGVDLHAGGVLAELCAHGSIHI